jgi:transcriptional regulator with XRE-family HTH domain
MGSAIKWAVHAAVDVQIDRTYVSRLERGLENPTAAVLERMAGALGTQIVEFFAASRRGEAPPQPLRGGGRAKR